MSHPPIPPGCEDFYEREGAWWICFTDDDGFAVSIRLTSGVNRSIIAAVAEVAWLKEAERRAEACLLSADNSVAAYDDALRHASEAREISRRWREWGER